MLTFLKDGFAPELKVIGRGSEDIASVTLEPGHRLAGRVVDVEGRPVEGVAVCPDHWRGHRPFRFRFRTDQDGRFVWEDAPEDEIVFDFLKTGYRDLRNVPLTANRENELTMVPPTRITGTVVDAETGEPIPSFEITMGTVWRESRKSIDSRSTLAGSGGRFTWEYDDAVQLTGRDGEVLFEGRRFLRITAPGYFPEDSRLISNDERVVELGLRLRKGAGVRFRVLADDGSPVVGATVAVAGEGNPIRIANGGIRSRDDLTMADSDDAGFVALPPVSENPNLVITHPDAGLAMPTLDEVAAGGARLTPWGTLIVESTSIQKGKELRRFLNTEIPAPREGGDLPDTVFQYRGEVVEDGVAVFRGVLPGEVRVRGDGSGESRTVEVRAGEEEVVTISESE